MHVMLLLEDSVIGSITSALTQRGHQVTTAPVGDPGESLTSTDLVIADAALAGRVSLLARVATASPGTEVILIGSTNGALAAEVLAHVERPIDLPQLLGHVDEVAEILDGERQRESIDLVSHDTLFAGDSPPLTTLVRRVRLVARSDAPVWIFGEDGSGRAIVARAIHDRSSRRNAPFVAFNTAAYSDEDLGKVLAESEQLRTSGCTLFLEQIGAAGASTQRELVNLLEHRRGEGTTGTSARIIVGMQPDGASSQRALSQELYYQLKVLEVEVPRLRERTRDIEPIVHRMLQRLAGDTGASLTVTAEALRVLARYSFPGNLLELAHALTHAFVVAHGRPIEPQHLPPSLRQPSDARSDDGDLQSLDTVARRFEREYLLRVLRTTGGNRGRAAEILGLSRKGLWGKLKAHGISDDDIDEDDLVDAAPDIGKR